MVLQQSLIPSTIPLSSKGNDPDGALETIQYYVDGEKYKNPQSRIPGISEDTQSYPISFRIADTIEASDDPVQSGVRSLFVIGKDNSGNNVASDIYNISFTAGREPPNIEIAGGLTPLILSELNDFNVTIDDGRITDLNINEIETSCRHIQRQSGCHNKEWQGG